MITRNQTSSRKRQAKRRTTLVWTTIGVLVLIASASAWFLRSKSQLLTSSTASPGEQQQTSGDDSQRVKDRIRHRDRSVEPELTDEQYREMMLARDAKMIARRRAEMRERRDQSKPKIKRDIYDERRSELRSLIAKHGKRNRDNNPRSIVNDAIRQLRELEDDAPPR